MVFAVDPTLAFRDFQLLKLKYDKPLSNFAFNCNLRHYIEVKKPLGLVLEEDKSGDIFVVDIVGEPPRSHDAS